MLELRGVNAGYGTFQALFDIHLDGLSSTASCSAACWRCSRSG